MKILVADDEKMKRITLAQDLAAQGHEVVTAGDGAEALEKLAAGGFDVVVTDLKMPNVDGIELLKRIKQDGVAQVEVIIMTAYGSIPLAVEAGKLGAFDFLTKPFRNEDIFPLLARIESARRGTTQPGPEPIETTIGNIDQAVVGQSPAMQGVRRLIEICTRSDANVLLCGETGVGKDLIASTIHRNSHRRTSPFVKVGCTLFPSQLIESELYGHEKGSFTGAEQRRLGRFELAEGGTLYLDDVDDIPLEQQTKLLRAIEEKVFERVGATAAIRANVRIIASTKRDLLQKIAAGTFRQDLYYRLDVLRVNIPPLRERREDIAAAGRAPSEAVRQGRRRAAGAIGRRGAPPARLAGQRPRVGPCAPARLPGRRRRDHRQSAARRDHAAAQKRRVLSGPFQETIDKTERELLQGALQAAGGNKSAAAAALGMKLSTFRDKLVKARADIVWPPTSLPDFRNPLAEIRNRPRQSRWRDVGPHVAILVTRHLPLKIRVTEADGTFVAKQGRRLDRKSVMTPFAARPNDIREHNHDHDRRPRRRGVAGADSASRATESRRWAVCNADSVRPVALWAPRWSFPRENCCSRRRAGNLDKLLASPSLWMCVACYACSKRCPRGIELTEGLWPALRDAAMQTGLPAARRTPGDLPERAQVRQRAGQIAPPAPGLGQEPGRAGARSQPRVPAGRRAVAGRLLPLVLSPESGRRPGLRPHPDRAGHHLGHPRDQGKGGRRVRPHVRRGGAVRDPGRGQPQALRQVRFRQAGGARSARLSGPCRASIRVSAPGIRCSTTPCSWPSIWSNSAADGQAGRGRGHVSRQLLRGPALRVLRSARDRCWN